MANKPEHDFLSIVLECLLGHNEKCRSILENKSFEGYDVLCGFFAGQSLLVFINSSTSLIDQRLDLKY
jgi:hypothetical protein